MSRPGGRVSSARRRGRLSLAALPFSIYAAIFIVAPLILIAFYSVSVRQGSQYRLTGEFFARFFDPGDRIYLNVLLRSLWYALVSTGICLLLGYPMAYILSELSPRVRGVLSLLFILPMWMNFLLRTYAWMTLLEKTGVINQILESLGLPNQNLMYSPGAVILGNVYNFLPFMILPIYTVLTKIDPSVIEAAQDLGANRWHTLFRVTFPLTVSGVMSGITMTFMPAVSTFIISKLLGGGQPLIGDIIEQQFITTNDWGFGSAMSVILMVLILLSMGFVSRYEREQEEEGRLL